MWQRVRLGSRVDRTEVGILYPRRGRENSSGGRGLRGDVVVRVGHCERVWLRHFEMRRLFVQGAYWVSWDVGVRVVEVFQGGVGVVWRTRREGRRGWRVGPLIVEWVLKLSLRDPIGGVAIPTPLSEEWCLIWIGGGPIICEITSISSVYFQLNTSDNLKKSYNYQSIEHNAVLNEGRLPFQYR